MEGKEDARQWKSEGRVWAEGCLCVSRAGVTETEGPSWG